MNVLGLVSVGTGEIIGHSELKLVTGCEGFIMKSLTGNLKDHQVFWTALMGSSL